MEPLKKAYGEELFNQLELVEADMMDEASIIKACAGATYIVHTASPYVMGGKDKDLVPPAINGTLSAMKAAQQTKAKRIVITSSCFAIFVTKDNKKLRFGPDDWSDVSVCPPYEKSKTLAEQAAWKFIEDLPADEKFELVTVNPGMVIGPNYNTAHFSSGDIIRDFMTGKMPGIPDVHYPAVDVRNVAEAHLQAVLKDEAAGNRFILASPEAITMQLISDSLREKWGAQYPKVPTKQLPRCMFSTLGVCDSQAKSIAKDWGKVLSFDQSLTINMLGIEFIPLK
jgi:dihydroflavonol-4-reductase